MRLLHRHAHRPSCRLCTSLVSPTSRASSQSAPGLVPRPGRRPPTARPTARPSSDSRRSSGQTESASSFKPPCCAGDTGRLPRRSRLRPTLPPPGRWLQPPPPARNRCQRSSGDPPASRGFGSMNDGAVPGRCGLDGGKVGRSVTGVAGVPGTTGSGFTDSSARPRQDAMGMRGKAPRRPYVADTGPWAAPPRRRRCGNQIPLPRSPVRLPTGRGRPGRHTPHDRNPVPRPTGRSGRLPAGFDSLPRRYAGRGPVRPGQGARRVCTVRPPRIRHRGTFHAGRYRYAPMMLLRPRYWKPPAPSAP